MRFVKKTHFFCFFLLKNLHISKKSCTFAPDFKKEITKPIKETQKETKNYDTNKLHKVLPRARRQIECFCNSRTRNAGAVASADKLRRKVERAERLLVCRNDKRRLQSKMQSAERFANGIFYKSSIKRGKGGASPRNRNQIRTSTTTRTIYAKSKKGVPQRRPGSGNLRLWTGARKVPQGYNFATDRAPDLLKQKKTK